MIFFKLLLLLALNFSSCISTHSFGTCKTPLIHNIISLFPSTCQIFLISNTTLSSSSFNEVKVPVVLTIVTTKPVKRWLKQYHGEYLLARKVRCRIIVLYIMLPKALETDLNYFKLHFGPPKPFPNHLESWTRIYHSRFRFTKPPFLLSLTPIPFENLTSAVGIQKFESEPFTEYDDLVFLSLPKNLNQTHLVTSPHPCCCHSVCSQK